MRTAPLLVLSLAGLLWVVAPVVADTHLDVSYDGLPAISDARRLDIYSPATPGGNARPVFVYVHGGGWTHGDKSRVAGKPEWLNGEGFVLVSVDYRLLPEGPHPAAVVDLAAAINWIVNNIADYGGDPKTLFLIGHSSAGHTISLLATDERFLARHRLSRELLRGVVCLDATAFDLEALVRLLPAEERQRYLDVFGNDLAQWRGASPAHHIGADDGIPPFLFLIAGTDTSSRSLNWLFARRLDAAGVDVTLRVFPDETHNSINARLGGEAHAPTASIDRFVRRLLQLSASHSVPR